MLCAAGSVVAAASPAAADTGGYPYANATDCSTQFGIFSWCINGKDISPYNYGYRNCTDYVAWKIQQVFNITLPNNLGNANTWGPRLKADGYSYDSTPQVGDIAAWNTGGHGFGHVAYVYAVSGGIASLDEYNALGTGLFSADRTTAKSSDGAPSEYVHIGSLAPPPTHRPNIANTPVVVRPDGTNWEWFVRNSNSGGSATSTFLYGRTSDIPVWGDWTGTGQLDPGVVRADGNNWEFLLKNSLSGGNADSTVVYGNTTDMPVVGDWDGNGTYTVGVARKVGNNWDFLLRNENNGGSADTSVTYGSSATDVPVVGDWDGNGTFTVGVVRPDGANQEFLLRNENSGGAADISFLYGRTTDAPIVGDWDGNGTFTAGVIRPSGNNLNLLLHDANAGGSADISFLYGLNSDRVVSG